MSLGTYGSIYVAGLSLSQAKQAIEAHLSKYLYRPEVSVDVYAYNSKFYYVITDGGGYGAQVYRLPITGSETASRTARPTTVIAATVSGPTAPLR